MKEQQKTDAIREKEERLRKAEQKVKEERIAEQELSAVRWVPKPEERNKERLRRKDSGKTNVCTQGDRIHSATRKKKKRSGQIRPVTQRELAEVVVESNDRCKVLDQTATGGLDESAKTDYVEGIPPWKNVSSCLSILGHGRSKNISVIFFLLISLQFVKLFAYRLGSCL